MIPVPSVVCCLGATMTRTVYSEARHWRGTARPNLTSIPSLSHILLRDLGDNARSYTLPRCVFWLLVCHRVMTTFQKPTMCVSSKIIDTVNTMTIYAFDCDLIRCEMVVSATGRQLEGRELRHVYCYRALYGNGDVFICPYIHCRKKRCCLSPPQVSRLPTSAMFV